MQPPMTGGEAFGDLAEDVRDTTRALLPPGAGLDVVPGYSPGALVALRFCANHDELVRRVVIENPPGSRSNDFVEVAKGIEADCKRT